MSELTIEILREKFKEAQEKGEELIVLDDLNHERSVLYVGDVAAFVKYKHKSKDEYSIHKSHLHKWKIKQPKDEYEVFYKLGLVPQVMNGTSEIMYTNNAAHRRDWEHKIMRNKRTGEIVNYDVELLK